MIYSCDCVPSRGRKVMELFFFHTQLLYFWANCCTFLEPHASTFSWLCFHWSKKCEALFDLCVLRLLLSHSDFKLDFLTFLAQKNWNSQTLNCRSTINLLNMHRIAVKGAVWPVTDFHFRKAMCNGRKGKPCSVLLEQTRWANSDEIKSDHLLKT